MADATKPIERFNFFRSYAEAARLLDDSRRLQFYDAITGYVFDGEIPDFSDQMLRMAWTLVEPNVKKSVENVRNGQKGGRPKKQSGNPPINPPSDEGQRGVFDHIKPPEKPEKEKEWEEASAMALADEEDSEEGKEYRRVPTLEEVFDFAEEWGLDHVVEFNDLGLWLEQWQAYGWVDDDGNDMSLPVRTHDVVIPRWKSMLVGYEEGHRHQAGIEGKDATVTPPINC